MHKMRMSSTSLTLSVIFSLLLSFSIYSDVFADDPVERDYDVRPFSRIYLKGPYRVLLRQGEDPGLRIVATESQLDRIEVDSGNGMLSVEWDKNDIRKTKDIELQITFKTLERIEIVGAIKMESIGILRVENLKIEFEGAGDVDLELEAEKIIAEIEGVGSFELSGKTIYHKVDFSGVGSYNARDLFSDYTIVDSNGVGNVKVYAAREFIGNANGVGSVDYWGDPDEEDIHATGVGSVNRH